MIGRDDDPNHKGLRRIKSVVFQGPIRLQSALIFTNAGEFSSEQGGPFNWHLESVPGISHSNRADFTSRRRRAFRTLFSLTHAILNPRSSLRRYNVPRLRPEAALAGAIRVRFPIPAAHSPP